MLLFVGAGARRRLGLKIARLCTLRCLTSRGMLAGGVEAAVEAATGGVGAGAPTAAEWDDRNELDYTSLGSSPAQNRVFNSERYTRHS